MIEKQDKIYEFVVKYIKENLYPPSTREIQEALGISGTAEVSRDLKRLEARGLIELGNGARKIKLSGYEIVEKRGKINE